MNNSNIVCIALAIALSVVTWLYVKTPAQSAEESENAANQAYDCIISRASCRSFTDSLVSEAAIDSLLKAAMASPSACDQRVWQFVVITDSEVLDSIASKCKNMRPVAKAPMAIAVCADMELAPDSPGHPFWVQDVSAATENLLLAAHSMGLGAVWCGCYPIDDLMGNIRQILELPATVMPLNVIAIGYPDVQLNVKDKFDRTRIHYNSY